MKTSLLYYRGSGPAAWFIRKWTKSQFAHVAPCVDGVINDVYWTPGVTSRFREFGDLRIAEQVLPFDDAKSLEKSVWLQAQKGKRYDKLAIIIIGLTKRFLPGIHVYDSRQRAWICSRLASVVAEIETECWGLNGPPSPQDVYELVKEKYHA